MGPEGPGTPERPGEQLPAQPPKPPEVESPLADEEIEALEGFGMSREDIERMGSAEAKRSLEMLGWQPKTSGAREMPAVEGEKKERERAAEVEKELKEMRAEERGRVGIGLNNLGFFVEEWKDKFFAKIFGGVANLIGEKGTTTKFWEVLGKNFEKDAERARKKIKETGERKKIGGRAQVANVGYLMGNILKYGRTVTDVVGYTLTSPLRYAMMSGMAFARGAEAAKEARLLSEGVIEKTRIEDADKAAEEAWKIYEGAKAAAGERPVTAEELQRAYQGSVPKDIIERLRKKPEAGFVSGVLQGIVKKDVEWSVAQIEKKIQKIEVDEKLSKTEKELQKQRILDKYSRHLGTLDRAVSQQGTVDMLALGAKYTETAAKAVVAGMMVETLALSMQRLWEWKLAGIFSDLERLLETPEAPEVSEAQIPTEAPAPPEPPPTTPAGARMAPAAPAPEVAPSGAATAAPEAAATAQAAAEAAPTGEYVEVAQRGDSVWSMAREQLERHYGQQFSSLNEAQQTYLIDSIKDRIAANPSAFGLTDIDHVEVGQRVDYSSIFSDPTEVQGDITEAQSLTQAAMDNIKHNNAMLREWVHEHPTQRLTSEEAERILRGGAAGETAPPVEAVPQAAAAREVGDVITPREVALLPTTEYVLETSSGSIRGHFNVDGRIITGVVIDGPNNYATTDRLFTGLDHVRAAEDAARADRLPRGFIVNDGITDIYNRASRVDLTLRFRNALPSNFPNREYATDYLNGLIRRLIRDGEDIYGDIFKSESRILRMSH